MVVTGLIGKVAGGNWFNKNALLTAFFPNLACWVVIAGLLWTTFAPAHLDLTSETPTVVGASFLFVVWVVAFTFFTINTQPALLRLYRGEWSPDGPLGWLARAFRERWRRRIREIAGEDEAVEEQQNRLDKLRERVERITTFEGISKVHEAAALTSLDAALASADAQLRKVSTSVFSSAAEHDLKGAIETLEKVVSWLSGEPIPALDPNKASIGTGWSWLSGREAKAEAPEPDRALATRRLAAAVRSRIGQLSAVVEADRQWLHESTRYHLPDKPESVGPTRLGNVFRTTEETLEARYGVRPWLLTSHLRMVLPAGYTESVVDDPKLGLDLSVTLSALVVIYGAVVCALIAFNWPHVSLFTATYEVWSSTQMVVEVIGILVVATLAGTTTAVAGERSGRWSGWPLAVAAVVATILLALLFFRTGAALRLQIGRFAVFLILATLLIGASRLCYLNAVEAAVVYCEGVKTLFDTHRTRILSAMRIRIPSTLEDERMLWRALCLALDREYEDEVDPRYVVFTNDPATALAPVGVTGDVLDVVAPTRPLPAFSQIDKKDLRTVRVWSPSDDSYLTSIEEVSGKHLLTGVASGQPIAARLLSAARPLDGRGLCAIAVSSLSLPPEVRPGAKVTIVFAATNQLVLSCPDCIVTAVTRPQSPAAAPSATAGPPTRDAMLSVLVPESRLDAFALQVALGSSPAVAVNP